LGHLRTPLYAAPVDNEVAVHGRTVDALASLNGCGGP
jgi:hypothetical protein